VDRNLDAWLLRVAHGHQLLCRRRDGNGFSLEAVRHFALAVLTYALIEERYLFDRNPLVDPSVINRLQNEHERISDDLDLLESLSDAAQECSDRDMLARSLLDRLQEHVAHEERLIYEPLRRAGLSHEVGRAK
jgi:hypothetical protein